LAAKNMAVVLLPPYLPDLAICDFFLFPRMKLKLKWRHFQDVTEIQEQSLNILHAIPKVSSSGASSSGRNAGPIA
jgi:hypothetical protein